jgi:hypothetical protein
MIDHTSHIVQIVKDELAKACQSRGVDKLQAGYAVGGFGALIPLMSNEGVGIGPGWTVMISLRSLLLGQPPIAASIPVANVLPGDLEFRKAVNLLLTQIDEQRQKEFRGEA